MNVKEKAWYPIGYMFAVTALFSAALIGFARWTRPRVEANERQALEFAVLSVLPGGPLMDPGHETPPLREWSPTERHELFATLTPVTETDEDGTERVVEYRLIRDGDLVGHAILFEGQGFWNPIRGVVGIRRWPALAGSPDEPFKVIRIAFYEQNETPGLGAEITTPRFRDQFRKGKLVRATGRPLTFVPESAKAGESKVNAISGATQTCNRLERIINDRLTKWREAMAERREE